MTQLDLPHMDTTFNTVEVNDLDHFVNLLSKWHSTKTKVIKHLLDIPETAEVSIGTDAPIVITGEFRKGFQLGISLALAELGELPFVAELEESAAVELKH